MQVGLVHFRKGAVMRFNCEHGTHTKFIGVIDSLRRNGPHSYLACVKTMWEDDGSPTAVIMDRAAYPLEMVVPKFLRSAREDYHSVNIDYATELLVPAHQDVPFAVDNTVSLAWAQDDVEKARALGYITTTPNTLKFSFAMGLHSYIRVQVFGKYRHLVGDTEVIDMDGFTTAVHDAGIARYVKHRRVGRTTQFHTTVNRKRLDKFIRSQLNKFKCDVRQSQKSTDRWDEDDNNDN
jgi:hypothetical protein